MSSISTYNDRIKSVLDKIPEYKKTKKKKIDKRDVILRLKNALIKQNVPEHLICSEITKILRDYEISSTYIFTVLDSRFKIYHG